MMNKRLLLAGMVAAISISAVGVPTYAAATQQTQTAAEQGSDKNNDNTGEKPQPDSSEENPQRKQ